MEKKADVAMKGRMCGWVCGIDMVGWEVVQKEGENYMNRIGIGKGEGRAVVMLIVA